MNDCASLQALVVGQFPPPVNGFSYVTQEMAKLLASVHEVKPLDLRPHAHEKGAVYYFERLRLALSGAMAILRHAAKARGAPVYLACDGGFGIVYFLLLAAAVRVSGARAWLHHHNFSYIDKPFFPMALLLKIFGRSVTHIFLSEGMARKFAARYACPVKGIALSNSAFVQPSVAAPRGAKALGETLIIGLLGNLNEEKGLYEFLETLRQALARGMNVKAVLAGPAPRERDRQAILAAQKEFGDRLEVRGAVYGEDKLAFYRDIDAFVFPTRYASEAQPTVVFEAMAHGVPSLSYDRGCVKDQIGEAGAVAPRDADFPAFALGHIAGWLSDPEALATLRRNAQKRFLADRAEALALATRLFSQTPKAVEP